MSEEWRDVIGCEGLYEVSNFGRVRGVTRFVPICAHTWQEGCERIVRGKIRKPSIDKRGYFRFVLRHVDGKLKLRIAHRMVLESFVGPCPANMEGCHNDSDSQNNNLSNLRWDTRKGNAFDRIANNTHPKGELNFGGGRKLTDLSVCEIKTALAKGETGAYLSRKYGVTPTMIARINTGKAWSHINIA